METHLSHLLPVHEACDILGEHMIVHITKACILYNSSHAQSTTTPNPSQQQQVSISESEIPTLVAALFYRPQQQQQQSSSLLRQQQQQQEYNHHQYYDINNKNSSFTANSNNNYNNIPSTTIPSHIRAIWKRWYTTKSLYVMGSSHSNNNNKQSFLSFVVPHTIQPGIQGNGHMGLFDCIIYALQGYHNTSTITTTSSGSSNNHSHGLSNPSSLTSNSPMTKVKQNTNISTTMMGSNINSTTTAVAAAAISNTFLSSSSSSSSPLSLSVSMASNIQYQNVIWIPDIIIFFAICQQYRNYRCSYMQRQLEEYDDEETQENEAMNDDQNRGTVHENHNRTRTSTEEDDELQESARSYASSKSAIAGIEYKEEQRIVYTMAQLAFRIYSSYMKQHSTTTNTGTTTTSSSSDVLKITRDTIHRFMTDIYGDDSYKIPSNIALLDAIFYNNHHANQQQPPTSPKSSKLNNNNNNTIKQQQSMINLQATVNEVQFCKRCLDTVRPDTGSHILLDWISILGLTMKPIVVPSHTKNNNNSNMNSNTSVQKYLDIIYTKKPPICSIYGLTETRIYEIKRRFHSFVQQNYNSLTNSTGTAASAGANNNDNNVTVSPLKLEDDTSLTSSSVSTPEPNSSSTTTATTTNTNMAYNSNHPTLHNKHVITQASFCYGVSCINEEFGYGGYIPATLAELIFRTGYYYRSHHNSSYNNISSCASTATAFYYSVDQYDQPIGWTLYHVLQFGCIALRIDASSMSMISKQNSSQQHHSKKDPVKINYMDLPLLRFLFTMFQLPITTAISDNHEIDIGTTDTNTDTLSRRQVAYMITQLIDHAEFRRRADAPRTDVDDENATIDSSNQDKTNSNRRHDDIEEQSVSLAIVVSLGLVDPPEGSKPTDKIVLKRIIDHVMDGVSIPNQMTFDEFCIWNMYGSVVYTGQDALDVSNRSSGSNKNLDESNRSTKRRNTVGKGRLHPLMVDLRLVAGVKFGIPPTLASLEVSMIAEIERRHQRRYPTSDVARRGPRGTVWNIIDANWFKTWATHVQSVEGTPEDSIDGRDDPRSDRVRGLLRISNTGLLIENGSLSLRQDIRWKNDYELLAPLAWSALQAWYDGGPPIQRTVVKYYPNPGTAASPHSAARAPIPTEYEIELHPFFATVYLCDVASRGVARPFQQNYQMSCVSPILVLLVQLCKELDVSADSARLWVIGSTNANSGPDGQSGIRSDDWILNTEMNIVEQRKRRGIPDEERVVLLLELKDKDTGLWPRGIDGKQWTFSDGKNPAPMATDLGDGIVGLYNMGNTCYLNSSIQCLSHTPILREYFTSKAYYKDINRTNPLGHEGRLAQVSAVLINELWKKSYNVAPHHQRRTSTPAMSSQLINAPALTPKTFKDSLGKFNEIFAGNEQHDAQELLAFLLGGLSEDLNRIVEKPYMEAPDSDGRPDSELADIWWSNHLKREMSIIVALFCGQYKSLLTCRTCKYESARFEPFSFLQLPLPEDDYLSVSLLYYTAKEGCCPMKFCVRVRHDGALIDVLIALAKILIQDETAGDVTENIDSDVSQSSNGMDDIYNDRARGMSIVVMREGYIARMAANTWLLQDQQNKDTGELPLMHVYEFDPIPNTTNDPEESEEKSQLPYEPSPAFIAVAQRRSELLSRNVLHPLAHRVFGTPLLLRIHDIDRCTGRDLYDQVARRLKGVVPRAALRFLSVAPDKSLDDRKLPPNGGANYQRETVDGRLTDNTFQTTTDMEDVAAGPLPRYGFRLRLTSRDGRRCLRCAWYESCVGCLVPDDTDPVIVGDGDSIVVDWHFIVDIATNGFGWRSTNDGDAIFSNQVVPANNTTRVRPPPMLYKNHASCNFGMKNGAQPGAVTLEECLDSFSKEEKIPEAYCSRCKDFRVQTKRMSLWRLPPVMIIHLKRFQFTQTMRRKLRDLVIFPIEGLDLSRIMASDSSSSNTSNGKSDHRNSNNEELKDSGRSEMLYDLYGVVHHQGALSGGHYVASLKSEIDGQWRLFNDAQVYEINARDVVDPSAYILFYIRRDVSHAQLSDYWDVTEGSSSISDKDMDQLLKGRSDRCVIM